MYTGVPKNVHIS